MKLDVKSCAALLRQADDILLFCHRDPDGDTYGSAMALFDALTSMGKQVKVECVSPFPQNLEFLNRPMPEFEHRFAVAVDVAAVTMFGDGEIRKRHTDLCIDHHPTNAFYAENTLLVDYAATGEAVYEVILELGAPITPYCATALLTAIISDTGCYRYSNTTPRTLRYGAALLAAGGDASIIRQRLFESKSRPQVAVESSAMLDAQYYYNGRIAVIRVSMELLARHGANEWELEGLSAKPICVDGVDIGITLKEREDGSVRVSMRSNEHADASEICQLFSGGGHKRASGCRIKGTLEEAEKQLVEKSIAHLEQRAL